MKYVLLFLQMIPAIIEAMVKIEEFIPVDGWGKEKIAVLRDGLGKIFKEVNEVWPAIEVVVAGLVKLANATVWKKDSTVKVIEPIEN